MKFELCDGTFWVCENHPDRPWEVLKACGCGGAGTPCPVCNNAASDELPVLPKGFETSLTTTELMKPLLCEAPEKPRRK